MKKSKINYSDIKRVVGDRGHINNKNEGKLLRKLMNQTGMSENDLRNIKKYRKLLSNAQKIGEISNTHKRIKYINNLVKGVTKELKLAKEHPLVIEQCRKILTEKQRLCQIPWYMIGINL